MIEFPEDLFTAIIFIYNNTEIITRAYERADIIYESYLTTIQIEESDETCI